MPVPFLDLKAGYLELQRELDDAYYRVANSGRYILGDEVESFEEKFAAFCEVRHCISTGNGLDALYLLLAASGFGIGEEVIVPSNTFIATWLAVTRSGATPVPVEPDALTFNIDAAQVERAISPRTRAIVAVHLYGQSADMDALRQVAQRNGLRIFEDAAQAHGARYRGR